MTIKHFDVCIIGGGPAGSTIANRLVDFGYRVVLIEKQAFPRPHIGLSLTTGIHHWLEVLHIKKDIAELHFRKATKTNVLWSSDTLIVKEIEDEKAGFHSDRGAFDSVLLDTCKRKGVSVLQPGIVRDLKKTADGIWTMTVITGATEHKITSGFLVEATGRSSVLKTERINYLPKLMATYAFWELNEVHAQESFIEAGDNHWYWGAPTNKKESVLCVFSDASAIKEASSIAQFYKERLSNSIFASKITKKKILGEITVCDATPYYDTDPISDTFIKVGDAAYTTDPISSQGVQKAIKSAVQGAIVVNTLLKNKNPSLAIHYYKNLITSEVAKNKHWTTNFYNEQVQFSENSFWNSRQKKKSNSHEDEHISLKKEDTLQLNNDGAFIQVPVLGTHEVYEMEGFLIKGEPEPFVFVESVHITPFLKLINGKRLMDCIRMEAELFPKKKKYTVLKWLIYQKIVQPLST